jgi:endonuclease/exonuclease/phosphatase family metal-dependent hydrolase
MTILSPTNRTELNIVVLNVMIPVMPPIRFYGQIKRAERIGELIDYNFKDSNVDVFVLNEVIPNEVERIIISQMNQRGFIYHTKQMNDLLTVNGGVIIFSKYEIIQEQFVLFGNDCSGDDCLASKGVVHACIVKNTLPIHIFATHLQAWTSVQNTFIRENQIQKVASFMSSFDIPATQPVIICGDFNTDIYLQNSHFKHILFVTNSILPEIHTDSHPFTVDASLNPLIGADDISMYKTNEYPNGCAKEYSETNFCPCCPSEFIDFILFEKDHLKPNKSWLKIVPAKVSPFQMSVSLLSNNIPMEYVSDHFPILGHFEFVHSNKMIANQVVPDNDMNTNVSQNVFIIIIIIIASLLFLLGMYVIFIKKKSNKKQVRNLLVETRFNN